MTPRLSSSLRLLLGLTGCALTLPATEALSQTASQITRDTYAPPVIRPVEGGLELPATGTLSAPPGAENLHVSPAGMEVIDGFPELADQTATIAARLTGKLVSGLDLFTAASDLEAAYARAGYILVRVTVPPQTIKDGMPLKLVVIDGYVERIDTSAIDQPARRRIDSVLAPLVGQHHLTKTELERRLLLAGDTPGALLRSTLKAGEASGATTLVVDGSYQPVGGSLTFDNSLSGAMGRYTLGLGLDLNSLLGLGETVYLRLAGYPGLNTHTIVDNDPRNRQMAGGVNLPIGTDGWWANLEAVDSRTHPSSNLGYTMLDHFQRVSGRLGYHWLRGREANIQSMVSVDLTDERQRINVGGALTDFTADQLRVFRFSQSGDLYTGWGGQVSGNLTFSAGIDGLGARAGTAALPLSRDGANPDFTKLEATARYTQGLADNQVQLSLTGHAQHAFGAVLVASEQLGLGGNDQLSGYKSGAIEVDSGVALRSEVIVPFLLNPTPTTGLAVAPYLFGAGGVGWLEKPTALEPSKTNALSIGAGLRFGLSGKGTSNSAMLSLEYAHGTASHHASNDRFNMSFIARF